jgi:hypothetical protein
MARKLKQSTERPTVGVRLPPALRDSLMAEAKRKRIRLAEEIRHRLVHYDEMEREWEWSVSDERANQLTAIASVLTDEFIEKVAERIARKLKPAAESESD